MRFNSIRLSLTIWFAATLAILMFVSELFWDRHLVAIMEDTVDEHLSETAEAFIFYKRTSRVNGQPLDSCALMEDFSNQYPWGIFMRIVDPAGDTVCATANISLNYPLSREALRHIAQRQASFETYIEPGLGRYRLMTMPLYADGNLINTIQIGRELESNDSELADLREKRIFYTPILILILSACGWFLADRALAPIRRFTADIRKIRAESLNRRLPVDAAPVELVELAESFNDTLQGLNDSFNRIRQFTGDASHELRTPLAILKGETEVSLRWAKSMDEMRSTLVSNLEEIVRMERITEDLLYLAKSDSGEFRLSLTDFSLNDMLQELYVLASSLAESKETTVLLEINCDSDVQLRGDPMHLHRAVLNLLSNAIKYTPDQGRVVLSLAVQNDEALIAVRDNGPGIAAEHLPHIFDRFYRADDARNRSVGGTGLGLAIVKAIANAHHGRVEVESKPGYGSIFTIHLPLTWSQSA